MQSHLDIMLGISRLLRGTRITVELILEKLATGEIINQVLQAHL